MRATCAHAVTNEQDLPPELHMLRKPSTPVEASAERIISVTPGPNWLRFLAKVWEQKAGGSACSYFSPALSPRGSSHGSRTLTSSERHTWLERSSVEEKEMNMMI